MTDLWPLSLSLFRGAVTPAALRALLCLSQTLSLVGHGAGMAELVRSDLFPSVEEISALAMQFGELPGQRDERQWISEGGDPRSRSPVPRSHSPVPRAGERGNVGRRRVRVKAALDMENCGYEKLLVDRRGFPLVDYIGKNIVSDLKLTNTYIYIYMSLSIHIQSVAHELSKRSATLPSNTRRSKTRNRSLSHPQTVHLYRYYIYIYTLTCL